ncbi:hypothetical protein CK203_026488 [Vitis vinifera]|uniref:Uncharacterized protein n=1 Tax=Vitis vinifera TaxID=29760 RepID=A0A438IVI2_VITVI|nr:hypothetical protein CK203_026488 [Vitis vinifera]
MLKRIPSGSDVAVPSAKMLKWRKWYSLLLDFSRHTDVFVSWVVIFALLFVGFSALAEASLSAARDDNEALRIELAEAKSGMNLQTPACMRRRMRWPTQKEELRLSLLRKGRNLSGLPEAVDEMYFFGYRCCMKKHGIKRDVPSIPPGEEEKLHGKPSQ